MDLCSILYQYKHVLSKDEIMHFLLCCSRRDGARASEEEGKGEPLQSTSKTKKKRGRNTE